MHQINIFTASIYLMGKWGFSRYKFDGLYKARNLPPKWTGNKNRLAA